MRKREAMWAVIAIFTVASVLGGAELAPDTPTPKPASEPQANTSAPKKETETISLSLKECIEMALINNLDIQIERLSPAIAEQGVRLAKSAFEPRLTSQFGVKDNVTATAARSGGRVILAKSKQDVYSVKAALEQPLLTGGTLSLTYSFDRTNSPTSTSPNFDPDWSSQVALKLTHPILRGAGMDYALSQVRIASNNKAISREELRQQAIQLVSRVESAYWNLVRAIEELKVNQKSLQVAEDLRRNNQAQVEAGTLAPLELLEAEAGVASREEGVIIARNTVRNREDELKRILNMPRDWIFEDIAIQPLDRPTFSEATAELVSALSQAFACRPELQQARLALQNSEISLRRAENELLPSVTMEGTYGYNGLGSNLGNATDATFSEKYLDKSLLLQVTVPLGNAAARSNRARARLEQKRAALQLERARQDVALAVRSAVRQIYTNYARIQATKKSVELQTRRLEAEMKKREVGRTTSLDVLEVEEDRAKAELEYISALIDYQISLTELEREKGTLLEHKGVIIAPERAD